MQLLLPSYLGGTNIQALFELAAAVNGSSGPLTLDAREVKFVDPLGLAVLGALFEPQRGRKIELEWMSVDVAGYLDRMGLFNRCALSGMEIPARSRNDRRTTLVELTCIDDSRSVDDAANRLATALIGTLPGVSPDDPPDESTGHNRFDQFRHPIQYMLSELLENALSHARREGRGQAAVWVAAQYYPSRDLFRIAVVDNGCGMLATLRHHRELQAPTHRAAIVAALQPRISCNRDLGVSSESINQGVGLTTAYRIASAASGGMTLVSGNGRYSATAQDDLSLDAFWSGVAITFAVKRQQLPNIRVSDLLPTLDAPPVRVRFE